MLLITAGLCVLLLCNATMREAFTVHLFSNLSEERDSNRGTNVLEKPMSNPLAYFRTNLSKEISLDEDYEVALTEISFTSS